MSTMLTHSPKTFFCWWWLP